MNYTYLINRYGMTPHQATIAIMVSKGLSNKDVASKLGISVKTVKFHLTRIYIKANVKTRLQLTVKLLK